MREKQYRNGDRRIQAKFLFFPKTINGDSRWLTYEVWEEIYALHTSLPARFIEDWQPLHWIDEEGKPT